MDASLDTGRETLRLKCWNEDTLYLLLNKKSVCNLSRHCFFLSQPVRQGKDMSKRHRSSGGRANGKMHKVMGEFKRGTLHSGRGKKHLVTKRSQAIAIGMSEQRRARR